MEANLHRGKGCKRSHPDKLAKRMPAAAHPAIAEKVGASVPPSASLQAFEPPRDDQNGYSACTAFALSTGLRVAQLPLGFDPSQRGIYGITRSVGRALENKDPLPPLADAGAELADVVAAIGQYGVCPVVVLEGSTSDITAANVNAEPDLIQLTEAGTKLVVGAYGIDPNQHDVCAAAIAAGHPLYIAVYADRGFEAWVPSQAPYGAPIESNPPQAGEGGHCMVIDAYSTNTDGSRTWRCVNSWGSGWGDDGTARVSDAFISACWEIWCLDVHLVAAVAAAPIVEKFPLPPKVPSDKPKPYYVPERLPSAPPPLPSPDAIIPSRYSSQPPAKTKTQSPKKDK
jgi:hypothetical protein